jgi:hypothetical protein
MATHGINPFKVGPLGLNALQLEDHDNQFHNYSPSVASGVSNVSVVSHMPILASSTFANNAVFQDVNRCNIPGIMLGNVLHALTPDECEVYKSLVEVPGSTMTAGVNHCINTDGDIDGYRYDITASSPATLMPLCRNMGYRHAMVQCIEETADLGGENLRILEMLQNQETILEQLKDLVKRLHHDSNDQPLGFDCMPEEGEFDYQGINKDQQSNSKTVDSRDWNPQPPTTLGIYHAYVKGQSKDTRKHQLFIVYSGCCSKIANDFYNIVFDARDHATAGELAESSEMWYLSQISHRNAARVLSIVADDFNLDIPRIFDTHSPDRDRTMAACTTETICSSVTNKEGMVSVFQSATNPCSSKNGILFALHPSEGIWLFKGPSVLHRANTEYGGSFGHSNKHACFPTSTAAISSKYSYSLIPPSREGAKKSCKIVCPKPSGTVAYIDHTGSDIHTYNANYTYVDEAYMQKICNMRWNRDNSFIELIPIAVVHMIEDSNSS